LNSRFRLGETHADAVQDEGEDGDEGENFISHFGKPHFEIIYIESASNYKDDL